MVSASQYVLWLQMATMGPVLIILMRNRIKNKIVPLNWMIMLIGMAFLRAVVQYIYKQVPTLENPGGSIHTMLDAASILAFYLFIENVINTKPPMYRISLISFFLGGFLISYIFNAMLDEDFRITRVSNRF